ESIIDTVRVMTITARVTAATVYGNLYAICTGIDQGDVPKGDITFRELCGTEIIGGDGQVVGAADIADVLGTGLFSSRGPHRIGWAHQTYAEFLAAHYLTAHDVPVSQMMTLLAHPEDAQGRP